MSEPIEFDCADCSWHVISFGGQHNPARRCAGCDFLATIADPVEREEMRAHMAEHEMIGTPRPHCMPEQA